ncbi:restriction endonuclease subunit S [Carnobacterium divergens]|uniref:restriction endonuclease subunit S n=1 Tax=Carnobacterium divergens TaxID=2748 RepID=UPI0039B06244
MAKIDDSVKKKVPELRFKGFTDDWEERKFADFIDVKSGKDYKHLNSGPIPVYGTGGYMLSVDRALSDIDAIGIGRKRTIDKPYLLKAPFWTVDTLFYAVPKQNIDLQFSLSIFKKINWKKFDESTGVPSLSKTVINSVGASVPCYEEQQKIGSFFKQLDKTIALHQRKLDLLKEQKKGYLQKMFPKNGAKVPELRFAGFVDDWEQRKLSDLMTFSNGINAPKENYGKGTKMISVMDILNPLPIKYDNILNSVSVDKKIEDKNKVENGDLIFVRSSEIVEEVGWAKAYKEARYALYSGFAIRGKRISSYNAYFIELTLNYANRKEIKRRAGGSTRFNVSQEILNSLTVLTPSISEQNQIDLFFTKIDDTITLHQRKLDLLKEQKKGFLQKMFV